MKYDVLAPIYHEAGVNFRGEMQYNVNWEVLGKANSMEDAKEYFGGNPVLRQRKD